MMDALRIPDGFRVASVQFSAAASTIVANVWYGSGTAARFRVYARPIDRSEYTELPYESGDELSYRSVVVSQREPVVFLNEWRVQGFGFEWSRVVRCDLQRMTVDAVDLRPSGFDGRTRWVADLLGLDAAADVLFASVGSETTDVGGARVAYDLAAIEVRSGGVTTLTRLDGTFL
jgi:hypothetical protein